MCRMELQGRMSKYRSDFNVRVNVRKYAGKDSSCYASKHGRMHVIINVYSSMQRKKCRDICSSSGMSEKFSHSDHAKFIGEALVPPEEPASWRVFKDCGKKSSCGNTFLRCFMINIWFFILRSARPWSRKLALQKQYIAVFGSEPVSLSPSSVHITGSLVGAAR